MKLKNKNIRVEIDPVTGATAGIFSYADEVNWIAERSAWGLIEGFDTKKIEEGDGCVRVTAENAKKGLAVVIEKSVTADEYLESYCITNCREREFFLTRENFGIPFPYDCLYMPQRDILNECCISHVWCGGNAAWIYSVRCKGEGAYLSMNVIEGAIEDYSISYDVSRTKNGSYYRGVIVLHPMECVILPGEMLKLVFRYRFVNEKPEKAELDYPGAIRLTADRYTVTKGDEIELLFESESYPEELTVICEGREIEYEREGNNARIRCSFDSLGERKILARADGKVTWIYVNVIRTVSEILQKRARFIAEKQQYHREGSWLDGAYLIYDDESKNLYYDDKIYDHNASRERIGMGVVLCRALRERYDEGLMLSLKKHREFVERELIDGDGTVYNHVSRSNGFGRLYNYPWMSVYYLEWYRLCGERKCIELAAKILIRFFEIGEGWVDAQCMEICDICEALEREEMYSLKQELTALFLQYADRIRRSFWTAEKQGEVSYVSELPNIRTCYLSQAYILTGDGSYLDKAGEYQKATEAFFARQPDFHLNCINVRYWDRFWFGKHPSYGDVFPHYWSALAGWCMYWYDKARCSDGVRAYIESNLYGNLCLFREDGFAANNYLYPYKVVQFSPDGQYPRSAMQAGVFYGKKYDAWANDQDWALYYAATLL